MFKNRSGVKKHQHFSVVLDILMQRYTLAILANIINAKVSLQYLQLKYLSNWLEIQYTHCQWHRKEHRLPFVCLREIMGKQCTYIHFKQKFLTNLFLRILSSKAFLFLCWQSLSSSGSEIFCLGGGGRISKSLSLASRKSCSAVICISAGALFFT